MRGEMVGERIEHAIDLFAVGHAAGGAVFEAGQDGVAAAVGDEPAVRVPAGRVALIRSRSRASVCSSLV